MSKKNDDFFVEKKPWSLVKDELLGCYLKPYVSKILHTYKPLAYVDCFAGKGKFDDGQDGSPRIAMQIICECLRSSTMDNPRVGAAFIDLNYADELRENLSEYKGIKIVSGKYEDHIEELLKNKQDWNVFLYIDPYGIKALRCSVFDKFATQFNSIELLINMNSFGFIREACRALGTSFEDKTIFEDLIEYDTSKMDASDDSIRELNEIAGGDYWQAIIEQYKKGEINGYEAEAIFAEQYCQRLSESYTYVLNMPLRIKKGQRPKYRLIHATNHRDGCLLMVDNICKRWEALQEIQNAGQMTLFPENFDNQMVDTAAIEENVIEHFSQCDQYVSLYDALAIFFIKHGPICSTGDITKILKKFEKKGWLSVQRNPGTTKNGKPTTFMTEGKGQTVSVRWSK